MNYALFFFLFIFFYTYFLKLNSNYLKKSLFFLAFGTKIIFTIAVWYVYTFYFSNTSLNDIYKYFNDGKILNDSFKIAPLETLKFIIEGTNTNEIKKFTDQLVFWTKPNKYGLLNDNQTIILINFLLCFVSNDNLFIQSIIISIISFYATFTFYKSVNNNFSIPPLILYFFIFFNPSYLIWTSGNFKETFIYIGLVFLFSNLLKLSKDKTSIKLNILIFINLIFILLCKNYFFIFLSPGTN